MALYVFIESTSLEGARRKAYKLGLLQGDTSYIGIWRFPYSSETRRLQSAGLTSSREDLIQYVSRIEDESVTNYAQESVTDIWP